MFRLVIMIGMIFGWSAVLQGRELVLQPGESVQLGETRVTCVDRQADEPLRISECQYWDAYSKSCLQERVIISLGNLQCVEECQHWDSYGKICLYVTQCDFRADQHLFIQTSCKEFDKYEKKCRQTRQQKLGP